MNDRRHVFALVQARDVSPGAGLMEDKTHSLYFVSNFVWSSAHVHEGYMVERYAHELLYVKRLSSQGSPPEIEARYLGKRL